VQLKSDIYINLITFTDVDGCELNPNQAYLIKTRMVENLVTWICADLIFSATPEERIVDYLHLN